MVKYIYALLLGLLLIPVLGANAQVNLSNGLVAYYPFNGSFNDASGNGNHGTAVNGATFSTDQWGNANSAAFFDGVNDYVTVPAAPSLTARRHFSLAFRYKPSSSAYDQILIAKANYIGTSGLDNVQYHIAVFGGSRVGNNALRFVTTHNGNNCTNNSSGSAHNQHTFSDTPTLNQWYCVVMTFDSGVKKIYVDGVLKGQATLTGYANNDAPDSCANGILRFGVWWTGDPLWYRGMLDEVRIYNRVLTTCEINRLNYNLNAYVATQPANQNTKLGSSAVYTVASGLPTGAVNYRWQSNNGSTYYDLSNGGQYSGVTTNSLTVAGIIPANANQLFRCIVSDTSGCADTTVSVTLNVTNLSVGHQQVFDSYLAQNVPNPSHRTSEIGYYIAGTAHQAEIIVYDMIGRAILKHPIALSGKGSVTISGLPDGSYCYCLILDGVKISTKRMQVVN